MRLADLRRDQTFRLPHSGSPTFTISEIIPGNPHTLVVCWCPAPNHERLIPKANGDNEHRADEAEHVFSSETVIADYVDFASGI
jgi:hypothetical protein